MNGLSPDSLKAVLPIPPSLPDPLILRNPPFMIR